MKPTGLVSGNSLRNKIGGCVQWEGHCNQKGYGHRYYDGKVRRAHRVAYAIKHFDGSMEKLDATGLCVLHHCDNRSCVNPDHLWLGTQADNMRDMMRKKRNNQASGEANGRAILTESDVREIRKRHIPRNRKHSIPTIAKDYGVSQGCITGILYGYNWKGV